LPSVWKTSTPAWHGRKQVTGGFGEQCWLRVPNYAPTDESRTAQQMHLKSPRTIDRYPGSTFKNPDELGRQIAYTVILDLLAADKPNAHLAALVDSLIEMAAMVFVDLMRLACVAGSEAARITNGSRYPEFVDMADLHLGEFKTHVNRLTAHIGSDAVQKCLLVERHLAYLLLRLKREPKLDRSWREIVDVLANLAARIRELAEYVRRDHYTKQFKVIATLADSAIVGHGRLYA